MGTRRRVAVPSETEGGLRSPRSRHVGRAPTFTLVDVEADDTLGSVRVLRNPAPEAGHGVVATLLVSEAVTDLVVVGIGAGMRARLVPAGVRIWHDARSQTVEDAVRSLVADMLALVGDADVHPGGHGEQGSGGHGHEGSDGTPVSLN